jgi:hypothetical protein
MRRIFSLCCLVLMPLAVPATIELATAAPAAAAANPCKAGEIVHVKTVFNPNPTSPGADTTNTVTIWNCTNQTQNVAFKGNVFGPSNCPPGQDFGPIPVTLSPNQKFVSKVTFPAPSCKGTYTQNIQVTRNGTLIAHKRTTFTVA